MREVEGMNAFFIVPTNLRSAFGELFMTHPPLEKRLARLADIAREMGRPVA
jgi:heat shock protein HtpX